VSDAVPPAESAAPPVAHAARVLAAAVDSSWPAKKRRIRDFGCLAKF